ncbi:MAG TPA: hypothetical protein VGM20_10375 [Gemmatimonadales bacterium]|jgi:hypothetical protein
MPSPSRYQVAALCGLLALGAGCSTGESSSLSGRWGGVDLRLVADGDSVQVRVPCLTFITPGPIHVNDDGTFQLTGTNEPLVNFAGGTYPIHLSGRISGSLLQASYYTGAPATSPPRTTDVQLVRGQDGSFSGFFCVD